MGAEAVLWPNPATDDIRVQLFDGNEGVSLTLIDASGRTVASGRTDGQGQWQHAVRQLPAGMYAVRVEGGAGLLRFVRP